MTVVFFDPEAREEFLSAIQYYEDCLVGLGLRFRHVVEAAIQKTIEEPFRYRVLHAPFRRHLLPKFPYAIIYSIEPEHIRVLAIAHTKRKPGYWLGRSEDAP
jgi:toxin ParE1/3/4